MVKRTFHLRPPLTVTWLWCHLSVKGTRHPPVGALELTPAHTLRTHQHPRKEAHDFLSSLLLDSEGGEVWSGDRTVDGAVVASALHVSVIGSGCLCNLNISSLVCILPCCLAKGIGHCMRLAPCAQVQVLPHALPGATGMTLAFFRRRCAWFAWPKQLNQGGRAPQVSMRKHFQGPTRFEWKAHVVGETTCRLETLEPIMPPHFSNEMPT